MLVSHPHFWYLFFLGFMPLACIYQGCTCTFKLQGHLTKHVQSAVHHNGILRPAPVPQQQQDYARQSPSPGFVGPDMNFNDPPPSPEPARAGDTFNYHLFLTGELFYVLQATILPSILGEKCDRTGNPIAPNAPPEPIIESSENPWEPFNDEVSFRLADLIFRRTEMSQPNIDELMDLWYLDVQRRFNGASAPFSKHTYLLETIDAIKAGGAPWQCFETEVKENLPPNAPEWQKASYQVWYRDPDTVISNILSNPDFAHDFDPAPYVHIHKNRKCRWSDVMSGNFAYRHAVTRNLLKSIL